MKLQILSALLSSVSARFKYCDIATKIAQHGDIVPCGTSLADCQRNCVGVLPRPIHVSSFNYLKNGRLLKIFRRSVRRCEALPCPLLEPFVICTKRSSCKLIPKECFENAVIATIRSLSKNKCAAIPRQARLVIDYIYRAACENNATVDQLCNFTSIALHNMHMFTKFTSVDMTNIEIGSTCRGLLQFKNYGEYVKLNSVSSADYIKKPYLLDMFSFASVCDEFKAYCKYYVDVCSRSRLSQFIVSIHKLAPHESWLVTEEAAIAIMVGTYKPSNILEEKVLRRFSIYSAMSVHMFTAEKVSVKIIEN